MDARLGNGEAALLRGLDPELDGNLGLYYSVNRRVAVSRTRLQVRNVSDPAGVSLAPEDIDMITVLSHFCEECPF